MITRLLSLVPPPLVVRARSLAWWPSAALFTVFVLCVAVTDPAAAAEPTAPAFRFPSAEDLALSSPEGTPPFQLAPAKDLTLSGPKDTSAPSLCPEFELYLVGERPPGCPRVAATDGTTTSETYKETAPTPIEKPWYYRVLPYLIPVGVFVGGLENSLADSPLRSFRFTNEGWFGANTYAGGADKAAHFVDYTIVSKELAYVYEKLGYSERTSILLGFGLGVLGGLANEFGDGFNQYGFSFQDLTMDTLGAGASALILATGTEDLFGFRYGFLLPKSNVTCCAVPANGRDYSYEIYTADLKLAGVGRRLNWNIGPLRYLLFSVTYGSKYYPSGEVDLRERQVGFEIGLNFEEILNSVGVRRHTWWGYGLHVFFDNVRLPFTSVGFQYDLNHAKWYGPGNGNQYTRP